ncbi:MAG TPA: hypothetical protein VF880_06810 [Actinomycetes bacterium]|jgi:hypothetical protein
MPHTIPCPECGAPAQITERFWLDSTDGPIEHLKTGCVNNHWLTPRVETVDRQLLAAIQDDLAALPR